ncbi:ATP-binding cassette domain-containing protein [Brachybacterium sp. NBEC-018]|uniref:ABC transporter ATP-binding protein n=1 Tax=Brachybacterium sp. NBEC-018 TaxID=2996004 RepID=UPI002174E2CE|nr:ATP-binding cassette domain-containing protein [Brachybacterium sp. NBEC-018]UVY84013.1 ATP-binding cassette domain-containing protein [Brachybacterium sp. NBEC-018]
MPEQTSPPRIEVDDLVQEFRARGTAGGRTVAVDHVSFTLDAEPGRIVSLVGQSGSGKSTLARNILGLQPPTAGAVRYDGQDVYAMSRRQLDEYRRAVQPVFQDPYAIFNPVYTVDRVLHMAVRKFRLASSAEKGLAMIRESLAAVKLDPDQVLGRYPHQLSGGQRQRVMLARVHLLRPQYVVADEPVSMLDAQVRKAFLDILRAFSSEHGMTTLFITHDLATVHYVGGDMMVLNRGVVVEEGPVTTVMSDPQHEYTRLLLDSVPRPDPDFRWKDRLDVADVQG